MITIDASVWVSGLEKKDPLHLQTAEFFRRLAALSVRSHTPSFALLEVACALSRRNRDPMAGTKAVEKLRAWPLLDIVPAARYLPEASLQQGVKFHLRAGDSTYAATAYLTGTILITWDSELIERAGGRTPTEWLAHQG